MIKINCDKCNEDLKEKGAILFSPPFEHRGGLHEKLHLCVSCWGLFKRWLDGYIKI